MAMAVRKPGKNFPAVFVNAAKFETKADLEKKPAKAKSCPPALNKKRSSSSFGSGRKLDMKARVLRFSYNYEAKLSRKYDKHSRTNYVTQAYEAPLKIGEGSFGKVYKAVSKDDGQVYALKKLKNSHGRSSHYKEVLNLEKLGRNPVNCVKFYMAWAEGTSVYIKLEYCLFSLATFCSLNHNIDEVIIWYMIHDIALALNFIHSRSLIHLDVKPGNIMISSEGTFKLGDFGLLFDMKPATSVRAVSMEPRIGTFRLDHSSGDDEDESMPMTCRDVSEGDCRYLSCETLELGIRNVCCDMFALGITVLEISCDLDLPKNGDAWQKIRERYFPDTLLYFSRDLIDLVCILLHPDYKQRPSAMTLLQHDKIKKVRDTYYRQPFYEQYVNNNVKLPEVYDSDYEFTSSFDSSIEKDSAHQQESSESPVNLLMTSDEASSEPLAGPSTAAPALSGAESMSTQSDRDRERDKYTAVTSTPLTAEHPRRRRTRLFQADQSTINLESSPLLDSATDGSLASDEEKSDDWTGEPRRLSRTRLFYN